MQSLARVRRCISAEGASMVGCHGRIRARCRRDKLPVPHCPQQHAPPRGEGTTAVALLRQSAQRAAIEAGWSRWCAPAAYRGRSYADSELAQVLRTFLSALRHSTIALCFFLAASRLWKNDFLSRLMGNIDSRYAATARDRFKTALHPILLLLIVAPRQNSSTAC